jgi:DNA-directed RNA polymerase subunit RPC12/RpoP
VADNEYSYMHPEAARTKTLDETDKKCPSCGGTMDYDPATGGLHCPFCDHRQAITYAPDQQTRAAELDFATAEQTGNCDWGRETKAIICKNCGAESVYDALVISNECPYCGSNQVMEEKGKNTLAPNGVVPFRVDIQRAGSLFVGWIRKKIFCPKAAKEKAKPESFTGVYLPYWTFDANTTSRYAGRYGIDRTVRKDGNTKVITDWYQMSGVHEEFINDQLVIATDRHEPGLLSRIEPFNTEDNMAYRPEFVAGFVAERYSIGLKDAWKRAMDAIRNVLTGHIRDEVRVRKNASRVSVERLETDYRNVTYKYLLLPVWLSSFQYGGKTYQFMINGQTGKVGGKAPVSPLRVAIAVLIGLALLALYYFVRNA